MKNIFIKKFTAEELASLAVKAMVYEVSVSPKAGLVTRISNGSHKDMDFHTFLDSAFALREYFVECFKHYEKYDFESEEFFKNLRIIGKQAEIKMFKVTKGVNTHKGTIFSMGILVATLSHCMKEDKLKLPEIIVTIKKMCKPLEDELGMSLQNTSGEKIYQKYKIKGARGLALAGYSIVLDDGIKKIFEFTKKLDLETSAIMLLFYYMSILDDTNIIARSNIETLEEVRRKSKKLYEKNLEELDEKKIKMDMSALNEYFIERNISSGGSADLLILTIFIYFLTK